MFDLHSPCANCPFKMGLGSKFRLNPDRLEAIRHSISFQCHKTVDYDNGPTGVDGFPNPAPGDKPQQCAGLMGLLTLEGKPNQIMQVAARLADPQFKKLRTDACYQTWDQVLRAHTLGEEPETKETSNDIE